MSTDLIPFAYENHQVRVVTIDGEPWFVLSDLCKVLGISDVSIVRRRLDDGVCQVHPIVDQLGRAQQATIVSEPGMYEVVIRSDKPGAVVFRRWLTGTVLPSIRKTGSYGAPSELTPDEIVHQALQITAARVEELTARVAELEPAAERWEAFAESDGAYSMNAVAKILYPDGSVGRVKLMAALRRDGVLTLDNLPRQDHVSAGRFEVKVSHWTRPDGVEQVSRSTRITAKGLDWLSSRYGRAAS